MTTKIQLTLTAEQIAALYLALNYHRHGLMKLKGECEGEGKRVAGFEMALVENNEVHAAVTAAIEAAKGA